MAGRSVEEARAAFKAALLKTQRASGTNRSQAVDYRRMM
jgi:hypothetical protein